MIAAFDVCYRDDLACAAAVLFARFESTEPAEEYSDVSKVAGEYVPGLFYRRELPPLVRLIERYGIEPEIALIDGYVLLDGVGKPGLGAYLYDYFGKKIPVIGIAKKRYDALPKRYELYRGGSARPLYVTALGMGLEEAKEAVRSMHGRHRIPSMLKRVDALSRQRCEKSRFS